MEIKRQHVSFEQAQKLRDKGFNIYCQYRYTDFNGDIKLDEDASEIFPYAPEHWQVIEWFRLTKEIWIEIIKTEMFLKYFFQIKRKTGGRIKSRNYDSPQEATSAAIDYVLEKLI